MTNFRSRSEVRDANRPAGEREYLARLGELESPIATADELAQSFAVMVRERRGDEHFQASLKQADRSQDQAYPGGTGGDAADPCCPPV